MDKIVTSETTLLTAEDKSILRKNTLISVVFITIFESIAYLILFHFIDNKDMFIMRICFFGFFLLVGLIIVFMNVSSYFDKNKIVSIGYVTNKRSHTRYSSGGRGSSSSSSTDYYITLGEKEMSVMINHYSQVQTGDKIRMHQTKWNKSIFRIEVLERAVSNTEGVASAISLSPSEINALEMSEREDFMDVEERSIIRRKLWQLLFWRTLVLGGVAYVLYYIFILVLFLAAPKDLLTKEYHYLFLAVPALLSTLFFAFFNKKTFRVFKDFSQGKKRTMTKVVTDLIQNNKPMSGKNVIITSGTSGTYYYVTTHDKRFLQIDNDLAQKIASGDKIVIHEALYSKIVLNATEAPTMTNRF